MHHTEAAPALKPTTFKSLSRESRTGVSFPRFFTAKLEPGVTPYDLVSWERRTATIGDSKGAVIFEQPDVEVPADWSQTATNIVVSKYFHGRIGTPERETSVAQLVHRVVDTIADWGLSGNYFKTREHGENFRNELAHIMLTQKACFNSPVWFNVGVKESRGYGFYFDESTQTVKKLLPGESRPQCSACFINSVDDTLESILDLAKTEGMLFKWGSGTGTNLSTIREEDAHLWGGGRASGPLSFMKGFDAFAGVIKSGGKCLAPYQPVFTSEGTKTVQELAESGNDFISLSMDKAAGRIKAKRARAFKSGRKLVVSLKTDKGEFHLSEDHPVLLADGRYVAAGSLSANMSLGAFSAYEADGYIRVNLRDGKKGKELLHRLVARDVIGWDISGKIVHHKQEGGLNNAIKNLGLITQAKHAAYHMNLQVAEGTHVFQTQSFPKIGTANPMHSDGEFWKDEKVAKAYRLAKSAELICRGAASDMQKLAARQKMINTGYRLINMGADISTFDSYVDARKTHIGLIASITGLKQKFANQFGGYDQFYQELRAGNHKVESVTPVGVLDVYDVEVDCNSPDDGSSEDSHNFGILPIGHTDPWGRGIFVHNTRRAAKMVILNDLHPDIEKFIWCKAKEEKKAHTLIEAGYDSALDGEAYGSIFFQNANNSVRATDEFMQAVVDDGDWWTKSVADGRPVKKYKARDLMRQIAEATHQCGDPGMQFHTTINRWHTSKNTAQVLSSNPCSEYMFLDDSACNLSSLNLMKFVKPGGGFDVEAFRHAVDTMILAQEIIVENASYPTEKIANNSRDFRPLGLGYANLGAMLMSLGMPYDGDSGRDMAAAITSLMSGRAYRQSALIAQGVGACDGFQENREPFLDVIRMHADANRELNIEHVATAAQEDWDDALGIGERFGFRNAQATVLAPTGTIGFMMDCDTTGIEPELALVKYKKMVGGGVIKIVNNIVPQALIKLGYTPEQTERIVAHIDTTGTIEGAPELKPEHLPVFDCSFRPQNGSRFIHHMGHVKMMAAVQPFISGAISKTINAPEEATVEDIMQTYIESWKLGLKAVAIYRDGSKKSQPLSSGTGKGEKKNAATALAASGPQTIEKIVYRPVRRKLPDERQSLTHKFSIGGHEGYITVGLYEDGTPGEVFISMAKEGSTISGLMDTLATSISYGLQYGVPLKFFVDKFSHVRFEPSGWTGNQQVPYAKSIIDYIFRWLGARFLGIIEANEAGESPKLRPTVTDPQVALPFDASAVSDSPLCSECGSIMTRNGSCYKCENCGGTSGCS